MSSFIRKAVDATMELVQEAGLPEGTLYSTDPNLWPVDEVPDGDEAEAEPLQVLVYWNGETVDPDDEFNVTHQIEVSFYSEENREAVYDAYEKVRRHIWDNLDHFTRSNVDPNGVFYRGTDKETTELPAVTQVWAFTRKEDF